MAPDMANYLISEALTIFACDDGFVPAAGGIVTEDLAILSTSVTGCPCT